MTEKRFAYLDYKDTVKDNQTGKEYHTWFEDDLLGLLNSLSEENEQIKENNSCLRKELHKQLVENEELKEKWKEQIIKKHLPIGFVAGLEDKQIENTVKSILKELKEEELLK